jgi:hypothetical protein
VGPGTRRSPGTASLGSCRSRAHDGNHDDHGVGQSGTARTRGDVRITDDRGANGAAGPSFRHHALGPSPDGGLGARNRAPDEMKPIEWLLVTTLAVTTEEDAERIVTWYSYRWRIERLHFTLKPGGSHVEDLP